MIGASLADALLDTWLGRRWVSFCQTLAPCDPETDWGTPDLHLASNVTATIPQRRPGDPDSDRIDMAIQLYLDELRARERPTSGAISR